MSKQIPFFDLRSPQDLLEKLKRDRSRIDNDLMDSDAAFDFFITASHLLEWAYPGNSNKARRKSILEANPLLAVCQMVADGAKHFELDNSKHVAVTGLEDDAGNCGPFAAMGPLFTGPFWVAEPRPSLIVRFDAGWVAEKGIVHPSYTVQYIARKVLEFWTNELKARPKP